MTHVPYATTVHSLMYAMVCLRHDLSQVVSIVSRYMHDPGRDHWEAVKWILRYIKSIIDVDLVFKKDVMVSMSVSDTLILITLETLTNIGQQRDMCLHYLKHPGVLLYSLLSYCLLRRLSIWP